MDVAASGMGSFDDQLELDVLGMSPAGSAVSAAGSEDEGDLRRGPWTMEEDVLLVNYIAKHGEGRWNSLARSAASLLASSLKMHSRHISSSNLRIAQHLPGRTDNEIKNYWRTRVQKHAKQLRCDVNSARFRDVVRYVWMPRLVERIHAESSSSSALALAAAGDDGRHDAPATVSAPAACQMTSNHDHHDMEYYCNEQGQKAAMSPDDTSSALRSTVTTEAASHAQHLASTPTNEGGVVQCSGGLTGGLVDGDDVVQEEDVFGGSWSELLLATTGRNESMIGLPDFELGDFEDNLWSLDDLCLHHQQWS
ncbi:hypothetical protein PR202_ga11155 [Eleusine coracana subsp. coracana]|uniref:Uncharacterized protein n=1 Tax=Eleusine coracana subsp. coracana TaxID=191504 RepID=A0AAV5C894_ELECO|nr:hypothetical protein PR202_ga11155 [Eleusine coracana subsp. coracana]